MRIVTILLSLIIMLFNVATYAQKRQGEAMQWKIAAELPPTNGQALGFAGLVAGVHKSKFIVGGGANFPDSMPWRGGKKKYYDDVYVYEKKGKELILTSKRYKLPSSIAYAASCATDQGIVVAGGESERGISKKVFLIQWNERSGAIDIKNLPDLAAAVTNAAATVHDDIIYLAGGEAIGSVSAGFYCLDLNNVATNWKQLPDIPKAVSHPVLVTQSNEGHASVYLIGGRKKNANGISELYSSVFKFDIRKNKWEEKNSLSYALSAGTGVAVNSKGILLFGGDRGETFHQTEILLAAISKEKNEIKKQELIQQKNKLQAAHPGFAKEVLLYNTESDSWIKTGCIPFESPVATAAVKWNNHVFIPGGEIKAGVRTPQILSANLHPGEE